MIRKIVVVGLVAFLVFFAATKPASAAHVVQHAARGLGQMASGLADFIAQIGR